MTVVYPRQTLQKRWKSIRGCFTREVKRQKEVKSGSAAGSRKSEYQYFKQLQFLQKVVAVRDISEEPAEDLQLDSQNNEETADRSQRAKRSKKRHKTTDPEDDPRMKARNNSIEKMEQLERAEEDEDRMFLLSLLEQNVEKIAAELKKVIEKATTKKKVTVRGTKGAGKKNDWWDKECEQSKKEAIPRSENKIREKCRQKKGQMRDRDKKEIKEIRTKKSEEITMQEWEEYFVKLREKGRRK
ncbi:hypothetical protein GEV33_003605 [Tenebrio molitor]|uniref:MADF domain-containing protein n=1 Tax=Tenebrio molitor TaxID=7067 RepID=A0A8J6LNG1_TENMO|nr:hypothetical protein GEV33_003605 [Tenebrio molitor]